MVLLIIACLSISFLLAIYSVFKEKKNSAGELNRLASRYRKEKIKGTIMMEKGKQPKHYSSYS